jgi:hypothetical protein
MSSLVGFDAGNTNQMRRANARIDADFAPSQSGSSGPGINQEGSECSGEGRGVGACTRVT